MVHSPAYLSRTDLALTQSCVRFFSWLDAGEERTLHIAVCRTPLTGDGNEIEHEFPLNL
jgi:hypothetical protein